ncbi:hypothetical protein [Bartonella apis]|uniref:hypothetical protein n=1 Tax=Bartonella apis TaxID=1686310 RepID=UPI002430287E|nr:hypothetical protein [Bartonella apis]
MDKSDICVLSDIGVSRLIGIGLLHKKQPAACFNLKPALLTWPLEASANKTAADDEAAWKSVLKSGQTLKCSFCVAPTSGMLQSVFQTARERVRCLPIVLAPSSLFRTFFSRSFSLSRSFLNKSKLCLFGFGTPGSTIRRVCTFCGSLSGIGIFECHIIFLRLGKEIFRFADSDHTLGKKRQNILAINRIFGSTGNNTEQTECDFFRCGCCIDSCRSYRVNNGHSFSFVFHQSLDEIVKQLVVFIKAIATAIFKPVSLSALNKRLCVSAPFLARAGKQKSNRIFKSIALSAAKLCLSAKSVSGKIKAVLRKSKALALHGGSVFEAVFSPELSEFFARQLCGQPAFFKAEKRVL